MSREEHEKSPRSMLGATLRIAHAAMAEEYSRWLATSPYRDIQPAHAAAIQPLWQRPEGIRLTELARIAHITKQSMGALVDSLEHGGYVERVADPDDGRAARIRLTARGKAYGRDVRAFGRDLERRLAQRMGAPRLAELKSALEVLIAALRETSQSATAES